MTQCCKVRLASVDFDTFARELFQFLPTRRREGAAVKEAPPAETRGHFPLGQHQQRYSELLGVVSLWLSSFLDCVQSSFV